MNLLDILRAPYRRQADKHGLSDWPGQTSEEYADARINTLTNVELVEALDDAFEQVAKLAQATA